MSQVIAYPSGFVAYSVGWPVQHYNADLETKLAAVRFSKVAAAKEKSVISNPIIEMLFKQWREMGRKPTQVDFLEDVCSAALQAFGTTNVYEWFHMQVQNPYFTANHREFLNETLRFIETGQRRFSHATWAKILRFQMATPQDAQTEYIYQDFFRTNARTSALLKPASDIYSFIARWLAQPGGFDDMLKTLHIIFGDNE